MKERMKELIDRLNHAAEAYYNDTEIMDNYEYDRLYDELLELETSSGIIMPDSPTQRAGYQTVDSLKKVEHAFPALSLDKTKDVEEFSRVFAVRDQKAVVMWKLDGSTVIVDYDDGRLVRAATRGNGFVGSDITHNAPYILGLPGRIPFTGKLTVRGEAVMSYREFDRINCDLSIEEKYKNPRNLANASISLLDSREMRKRQIWFHAFKLVYAFLDNTDVRNASLVENLRWLEQLGFRVVEHTLTAAGENETLPDLMSVMQDYSSRAAEFPFPVDGLVVAADDERFAESQPGTAHNPNKLVGYAYKWKDETARTVLRDIIWQASRTGLLNPVAVFDTVELEGTSVSRATLHNVSYIIQLDLIPGDEIGVYKANKIIPKVGINYSRREIESHTVGEDTFTRYHVPRTCPVCGSPVVISDENNSGSYSAFCMNMDCTAKKVGSLVHFVQRNAMNIIGLNEATIEKFVECGFVKEFSDFWKLSQYKQQIISLEGYGEKAYQKLITEIEKARQVTFCRFIAAIGIPDIGTGQAKLLFDHYIKTLDAGSDIVDVFMSQCRDDDVSFTVIDGFGEALNESLHSWGKSSIVGNGQIERLTEQITIVDRIVPEKSAENERILNGKVFVVTGSLEHFANRDELKRTIEELGGKVTGSVTSKTDYLINNDTQSGSAKNKKAEQLGIPVISEDSFLDMINRQ